MIGVKFQILISIDMDFIKLIYRSLKSGEALLFVGRNSVVPSRWHLISIMRSTECKGISTEVIMLIKVSAAMVWNLEAGDTIIVSDLFDPKVIRTGNLPTSKIIMFIQSEMSVTVVIDMSNGVVDVILLSLKLCCNCSALLLKLVEGFEECFTQVKTEKFILELPVNFLSCEGSFEVVMSSAYSAFDFFGKVHCSTSLANECLRLVSHSTEGVSQVFEEVKATPVISGLSSESIDIMLELRGK